MRLHTRILLYTAFGALMAIFGVTVREVPWDQSVGIGLFGGLGFGLIMDWFYRRGARQAEADADAQRATPPASPSRLPSTRPPGERAAARPATTDEP